MTNFDTFLEKFYTFGGGAPRTPIVASPYYSLFSHSYASKLKNSEKFACFPWIFSIIFKIFINFNAYFWKIISNFSDLTLYIRTPPPQTFGGPLQPINPACITVYLFVYSYYLPVYDWSRNTYVHILKLILLSFQIFILCPEVAFQ